MKLRYEQGHALSDGSVGEAFLLFSSLWCLLTILTILWLIDAHFSHMAIFSMCVFMLSFFCVSVLISQVPSFYTDTIHIRLWPNLITSS